MKIIGIGNALVDELVPLQSDEELAAMGLPKGGMTLIDSPMNNHNCTRATGGSAANTTLALAHMGADVAYIGKVGNDDTGRFFAQNLRAAGVDPRLIVHPSNASGVASAYITPDGERTFATHLGAAATMTAADITPTLMQGGQMLYVEGYLVQNRDMVLAACRMAKAAGMTIAIDLASWNVARSNRDFFATLIRDHVDIVFANASEAEALTGWPDPMRAAADIVTLCGMAVVKDGARGAYFHTAGGATGHKPAMSGVKVADTTAAGDFFAAGYLHALTSGAPLGTCLTMGALLAGHVIQVVGTHLPPATWAEINAAARNILSK